MKTGRNAPCPCGSGKKYKKCCLAKDQEAGPQPTPAHSGSKEMNSAEPDEWTKLPDTLEPAPDRQESMDDEEPTPPTGESPSGESASAIGVSQRTEESLPEPRAIHPRPKFTLPQLASAEQTIVNEWWKGTMPVYQKMNAAVLLARILGFLDSQPRLFPHLYLHEECLFELGAALRREGRTTEFLALLQRVREEQSPTYVECFGYYDTDLIEELTLAGRRSEIAACLNYFKQYSDDDPDNCAKLMNWLAWADYEEELMDLAKAVSFSLLTSPNVIAGDFAMAWLLSREYFPYFEARDASLHAAGRIRQAHQLLLPRESTPMTLAQIQTVLTKVGQLSRGWMNDNPPKDKNSYLNDLRWDYIGYLRRERRCGWVRAIFLANRLGDYFLRDGSRHYPFDLRAKELEAHMARHLRSYFHIDGTLALGFLQAVVQYAGYLEYHQAPTPQMRDQVLDSCRALYPKVVKEMEAGDAAARRYSTFEALCAPND